MFRDCEKGVILEMTKSIIPVAGAKDEEETVGGALVPVEAAGVPSVVALNVVKVAELVALVSDDATWVV